VSCKHMKANQLVSEVYYQGFNTDLEGALCVTQSLMQISRSWGSTQISAALCLAAHTRCHQHRTQTAVVQRKGEELFHRYDEDFH